MMRYKGIDVRDAFMVDLLSIQPDFSYLEIGVGIGGTIDLLRKKHIVYYGVDIAQKTIDYLKSLYGSNDRFKLIYCDVCSSKVDLKKKFDVIFSADTLEHVYSAENFFAFIARHLKVGGTAYIVYPNESAEKHHGILWFKTKQELMEKIAPSGLHVESLERIESTMWHSMIKKFFWQTPRSIFLRRTKTQPQVCDDTHAFELTEKKTLFTTLITLYAAFVSRLIRTFFRSYNRSNNVIAIKNTRLLITLRR